LEIEFRIHISMDANHARSAGNIG